MTMLDLTRGAVQYHQARLVAEGGGLLSDERFGDLDLEVT